MAKERQRQCTVAVRLRLVAWALGWSRSRALLGWAGTGQLGRAAAVAPGCAHLSDGERLCHLLLLQPLQQLDEPGAYMRPPLLQEGCVRGGRCCNRGSPAVVAG